MTEREDYGLIARSAFLDETHATMIVRTVRHAYTVARLASGDFTVACDNGAVEMFATLDAVAKRIIASNDSVISQTYM